MTLKTLTQISNEGRGTTYQIKNAAPPLHVLTLTSFYPSREDIADGCFVAEPLEVIGELGVISTVFAVQPFYRKKLHAHGDGPPAERVRYLALPGNLGLPAAGALLFARMIARIRKLHETQSIDLIHAHGPLPCGHAAMLLSRELGIPFVVSVHGLDAFSAVQVSGRANIWAQRICRQVYSSSRRVICVSERVREQVIEGMGRNCRTSVVYNGVNPKLFTPSVENSSQTPVILSVGNLISVKGHELLLRSAASLTTEFPSARWHIIGDGIERKPLQALAVTLGMADRVSFPGRQSRSQVAQAMRQCTLFALPSRYEALGCVYLEAMSSGKAVIGCRGQGIAEIIRHGSNGFLVGPDNEKELTLAMAMLLRDGRLRENLGNAARETILDRFTLAHQAETLVRIYRECSV